MSGMKILCVEDQPEDLAILTAALEGIGYEVMPASNGGQAIDLFAKQAVDGVLLEDNMPGATGTTLRTKLKEIHPDIPVLLFAESADRQDSCCASLTPICEIRSGLNMRLRRFGDVTAQHSRRTADGKSSPISKSI